MAYSLKYNGSFDNIDNVNCLLEIYEKDYSGIFYSMDFAEAPIIHTWGTDDPKGAVRGSSLTIRYINKGSQPIENFYSAEDDKYKVIFYVAGNVAFTGFLVQDDFIEPMLDYNHPVTLSANDGLGLLKDIELDLKNEVAKLPCIAQGDFIGILVPTQNWIYLTNINFAPVVGVPFTISGHPNSSMNSTFTPTVVNKISNTKYNIRTNSFTGDTVAAPCTINGTSTIPGVNSRLSLANIIHACLVKTGLELESHFYTNIFEDSHVTTKAFIEQTYIEPDTFISGEKLADCFTVLERICSRFNISFFQSGGKWVFVRWHELRLNNAIQSFIYDKDFNLTGTGTLPGNFLAGFNKPTYPEFGLTKSLYRPYEFVKETFNYQQPKYLLKNYDLSKLGALLRTNVVAGNIVKEYIATDWEDSFNTPVVERFIRVVSDNLGNELSRDLVMRGATGDSAKAVQSKPVDVTKGDKVKFSFNFKTNNSQAGNININFAVRLFDGLQNRYVDELPIGNGNWQPGVVYTFNIPRGDNTNQWHQVEVSSSQIPFDGQLYCYLTQATQNPQNINKETIYKDIRLELTQFINDSTKIIGHIHKDKQPLVIKNNKEIDLPIDDSPRNPIQGTLFTSFFNGLVQDRTDIWFRNGIAETKKLGNITTNEELQWRSISRIKLEGSFRGLIQGTLISPLTWLKYQELPGLNFVFGNLEIDYRNNKASGNLWELYRNGEADVTNDYSFTYIYDTK
jgi:hypothetical protein